MTSPRRLLAVALAAAAGVGVCAALPAGAHNPRDTPKGAPRMDLEVMVTPEIEGRITPGGTDPLVSVDGFGNRFAVARKEDAQSLVGVDQRARTATRAAAWAWTSDDDGLTWRNLDVLTRGAEQALPQGFSRDLASAGPLTVLAENRGAAVVVQRVVATGKGRLTEASTGGTALVTTSVPGTVGGRVAVATNGRDALVAGSPAAGPTTVAAVSADDVLVSGAVSLPGSCDVAADPRGGSRAFWAACSDGAVHRSTDGGASFARVAAAPATASPQVEVGPDGSAFVLSDLVLTRVQGARVTRQDLRVRGGDHAGVSFAVSSKGRVALGAYHRAGEGAAWTVMTALVTPGTRPVWYGFADHDPVSPPGAEPPSVVTSVDTDPQGRLQLAWASTFLHSTELGRPLLRNVFTARSVTS